MIKIKRRNLLVGMGLAGVSAAMHGPTLIHRTWASSTVNSRPSVSGWLKEPMVTGRS